MFSASPVGVVRNALRLLVPLSVLLTAYIYLYPVFGQCAFPLPPKTSRAPPPSDNDAATAAFLKTLNLHIPPGLNNTLATVIRGRHDISARHFAPFRLLALGDPQLEGDTSIPNANSDSSFPHLVRAFELSTFQNISAKDDENSSPDNMILRERIRQTLHDVIDFWFLDIPIAASSLRKRLDLFGNDFYLAHIVRLMRWWTVPTHVSVLGDLLGSQWVDDNEFHRRAHRFWHRIMRGTERVPDELALYPAEEYDLSGYLSIEPLANKTADFWTNRVINVAGNHDIGYAGDITEERLARFESEFGKANYELRFELPANCLSPDARAAAFDEVTNPDSNLLVPELRIINLNDMNLDTPAQNTDIQDQTYSFINTVINTASAVEFKGHFTVVLTHIPLYKPEGICVDAPHFAFHEEDGTLREQNLLSEDASQGFLQGIFGMHGDRGAPAGGRGRQGVVLNGHDHEGCDTFHFINQSEAIPLEQRRWETVRWSVARNNGLVGKQMHGLPGVREITVRSMMGDFGGNAGLLSAWFDEDSWEWQFEYATCAIGRQHMWWMVHVLDLITFGVLAVYVILSLVELVTSSLVLWRRAAGVSKAAEATTGVQTKDFAKP